jgi:hypothetical protein
LLLRVVLAVLCLVGCRGQGAHEEYRVMTSSQQKNTEDVLARHSDRLMAIPGVVGTALGMCQNRPGIKVYVVGETPALLAAIPETLEGVPVCLQAVGEVRAFPEDGGGVP